MQVQEKMVSHIALGQKKAMIKNMEENTSAILMFLAWFLSYFFRKLTKWKAN